MIRVIGDTDIEAWVELRHRALLDAPLAFASSPDDDFGANAAAARRQLTEQPESAIFGAFEGGLVGTLGIYRDQHRKCAHKAHIWGMYVDAAHRRGGLARRLLEAALDHAAALPGVSWVQLSVSSAAPGAQRLYERAGFRAWGSEPEALIHDGESALEHHMALRLADRDKRVE